jgi:dephospho-CoA kinase
MKRIYITGMSGTGKSSVIERLQARGFTAVDTDYGDWCKLSYLEGGPERILREDKLDELLKTSSTSPLFISGCSSNQAKFYKFFDNIVLFSAPLEVILKRVAHRSSNPYGKNETEQAEIVWNFENIQPLLKEKADLEIDTSSMSIEEITEILIKLASN